MQTWILDNVSYQSFFVNGFCVGLSKKKNNKKNSNKKTNTCFAFMHHFLRKIITHFIWRKFDRKKQFACSCFYDCFNTMLIIKYDKLKEKVENEVFIQENVGHNNRQKFHILIVNLFEINLWKFQTHLSKQFKNVFNVLKYSIDISTCREKISKIYRNFGTYLDNMTF